MNLMAYIMDRLVDNVDLWGYNTSPFELGLTNQDFRGEMINLIGGER